MGISEKILTVEVTNKGSFENLLVSCSDWHPSQTAHGSLVMSTEKDGCHDQEFVCKASLVYKYNT